MKVNRAVLATILSLMCIPVLSSCDQVTRHKVVSTLFDGVPTLPPTVELCEEYVVAREAQIKEGEETAKMTERKKFSHQPYSEKRCGDCHEFSTSNRLVAPARELCLMCHTDFYQGNELFIHGPVAVQDCMACHLPHTSDYDSLLVQNRNQICQRCHKEERLTREMHKRVVEHTMNCIDCHDPHYSEAPYFLK